MEISNKAKALRNLYIRGKIDKEGLQKALNDGTITAEEYSWIVGE